MYSIPIALPAGPSAAGFVLRYVARRPLSFAALLTLVGGAATCAVAVQYGMKLVVDTMAAEATDRIWRSLALFVTLIGVESALWRAAGWLGCHTIVRTGVDARLDLFRRLSRQPMRFFSEQLTGSLGSRVTSTTGATCAVLNTAVWQILPPIIDFVGAVLLFTAIDPRLALALVVGVTAAAALVGALGSQGRPHHQRFAEEAARVNGELVDVVANIWTVKAFSARAREHERLRAAFETEAHVQRSSWLFVERVRVVHDVCLWLISGGMFLWVVHNWQVGRSTAGDVVLVSALTFRLLHGSRDLAMSLVHLSTQLAVVRDTLRVIGRTDQVLDPPHPLPYVPRGGSIRLEGVTYGYGDGRQILRGFDLAVGAGEKVGVVGPSGAGKSTLVGLLQRLDDVQAGVIRIDDQPIHELAQDALRAAIAVVPQDVALFHRTVLENIRYGKPDATDEQVMAAARAAHCTEFVEQLPDGFDTVVGERGARLSGGQRQRVGIARAFLKDAPILVLDEATSALDSQSEAEIQLALGRLMRGRTVIAVAHRLATVSGFDRVVVLVDGRIVEEGSPQALRRRGGVFADLWRLQTDGFELQEAG